ncbi:MAG: reverse transcriptase domain-containing protein [archaeon]
MKTYKNIYTQIYNISNLLFAWRKARKGKTKKPYVIEFEKDIIGNLFKIHKELKNQTYKPLPLETFILRDPKTRKISKADFRDRIVHHAIIRVLEPIFEPTFIYDSCANRKGKGNLFALKRFYQFSKKVSENGKTKGIFNNNQIKGYCLKADIKHYFHEVDHESLLNIIKRKIFDKRVILLIKQVLNNIARGTKQFKIHNFTKGMPLGNLTSQFFANIYLNELDYFVKHELRCKYYIRYVDDFILLSSSKSQLEIWKQKISKFLNKKLKLELHTDKSRIISLSKGIDFVGFRNFYYHKLLRKRNIRKMKYKIRLFNKKEISYEKLIESFQGWQAYANWANSDNLIKKVLKEIKI